MASKKVGTLIKEARVDAGLTQEQLARKISGLSASDISQAERGLADLTQEQLKKIAKVTGVTQASLLNAAKGSSSSSSKKSTASKSSMQVTAAEKKLVEALKAMLGIMAKVKLVAPKSIARSEGKAVRIIDKRKI